MRAKEFLRNRFKDTELEKWEINNPNLFKVIELECEAYAREVIENAYSNCEAQDEFRQQLLKTIER